MEEAIAELARERRDSAALEARYADLESMLASERREKAEHRRAALSSAASLETERQAAQALQKQVEELRAALAEKEALAAVRPHSWHCLFKQGQARGSSYVCRLDHLHGCSSG
jgi:hypothetical protein